MQALTRPLCDTRPMSIPLSPQLNWDLIQADWNRFKAHAKRRWDRIGEQQLNAISGRRALLAARIKEAYSLSADETEKQITDWQSGLAK